MFVFTDLGFRNCYTYMRALAFYVARFKNYMQSSAVNIVLKFADIYRCIYGKSECLVQLQVVVG